LASISPSLWSSLLAELQGPASRLLYAIFVGRAFRVRPPIRRLMRGAAAPEPNPVGPFDPYFGRVRRHRVNTGNQWRIANQGPAEISTPSPLGDINTPTRGFCGK
jgi:hypothetical protein